MALPRNRRRYGHGFERNEVVVASLRCFRRDPFDFDGELLLLGDDTDWPKERKGSKGVQRGARISSSLAVLLHVDGKNGKGI